jgi:dATP/dGTP diphosphohydrolase
MSEGLRYDEGKLRMDLLPHEWVVGLAEVLTAGAKKYADRNWELGMKWSKVWAPALRHMFKFMKGERYDADDGVHHLFHAAWGLLALASYDLRQIGENNILAPTTRYPIKIDREMMLKALQSRPETAPAPTHEEPAPELDEDQSGGQGWTEVAPHFDPPTADEDVPF